MGKMTPRGPIQLTLVMLFTLLGCQRGRAQSSSMIYPPTPPYSSRLTTTNPFVQQPSPYPYDLASSPALQQATDLPATTTLPAGLGGGGGSSASFSRPMTPTRTTAQRTTADLTILMTTGLPSGMTAPASTPQRVQMTFNNRYSDLGINEYDAYGNRLAAQLQLAQACGITTDRLTDVSVLPNATGYLVLRFTIQQGYPIYISEAVQKLQDKAQTSAFMRLNGQTLELTTMVFWTDDGPCPVDRCLNGGLCNVTLSGSYECQCSPGYGGSGCQSMKTTDVDSLRTTLVPLTTGLPAGVTAPSNTPQRVQMTFNNRYSDLGVNEYDAYGNRLAAQLQLAQACGITTDRLTDVSVIPNATGYLVLRFTIQQGYPTFIWQAVEKLQDKAQTSGFMRLNGQALELTTMVFWTDDGPCLVDRCMNGGLCNVTLSGSHECQCSPGYAGSRCQDVVKPPNLSLLALLVLLVIPIAVALFVGFYFGLRRQQKQRLKRAFDLRDVRTIGPKSMLSLPHEPGMRNEMYDTRSFALAFTDTSFSKTSTPPSSSEDDLMSRIG